MANSPETWATEFVAGLLDIDYARQSRICARSVAASPRGAATLLRPSRLGAADKILFCRVLDPHLVQSAGSPIATASQWAANAKSGVRQTVSDLLTQPDPGWQQLISSGWQPPDARMDIIDVSGLLTVTSGSHRPRSSISPLSVRSAAPAGTPATGPPQSTNGR